VVWCGDGNNVCASFIHASWKFGFDFVFAGPEQLDPDAKFLAEAARQGANVEIMRDVDAAVKDADLIVTDTWVSMHDEMSARERRHNLLRPYQVNPALR